MSASAKTSDELRAELAADLDMLRSKGLKFYEHGPNGVLKVEFWPPLIEASGTEKPIASGKCKCGHPLIEHVNGLCAAQGGGCDPLKCSPPEDSGS